jgi:transcriptional regulator GlxA family with amidase domain
MNIRILAFDGADDIDFVGPLEVLRRAEKSVRDVNVALVTLEPQSEIVTAHGLRIRADAVLQGAVDLLVVPGGGYIGNVPKGVRKEIERGELPRRIAAIHRTGAVIAGVCTGTMAIAAAGILDGRSAVTHHAALADLRGTKARVVEARVVDDGDIITCGGVTSSLDLALWIVERFWGADVADGISRSIEYKRTDDIFRSNA